MTVVLNEAGLAALFESAPVIAFVDHSAQKIVDLAQANVRDYFGTAPSLHGRVDQEIEAQVEGSRVIVGIRDGGSKARRLADYQAQGTFPWLTRAVDAARVG